MAPSLRGRHMAIAEVVSTAETCPFAVRPFQVHWGARYIPGGNFTGYCDFCFNLGEQYIKQYMLKKRGYK